MLLISDLLLFSGCIHILATYIKRRFNSTDKLGNLIYIFVKFCTLAYLAYPRGSRNLDHGLMDVGL